MAARRAVGVEPSFRDLFSHSYGDEKGDLESAPGTPSKLHHNTNPFTSFTPTVVRARSRVATILQNPVVAIIVHTLLRRKRATLTFLAGLAVLTLLATTMNDNTTPAALRHRRAALHAYKARNVADPGTTHHPHTRDQVRFGTSLMLNPAEELAALVSFMSTLSSNSLPTTVNPAEPLDAQLVVEFDTFKPSARGELNALVRDTWASYPVLVFGKTHSPLTREVGSILSTYAMQPKPKIWELNTREDANVLLPTVYRLTNSTDLPVLLVNGLAIGLPTSEYDDPAAAWNETIPAESTAAKDVLARISQLHENGHLRELLQRSGALIQP